MPYEFTQEDYSKFSQDIINAGGDQATLTSVLADMSGTVVDAIAKASVDTQKLNDITAENERLKSANMELFLRVGAKDSEKLAGTNKGQANDETPAEDDGRTPTQSYMERFFASLDNNKSEKE